MSTSIFAYTTCIVCTSTSFLHMCTSEHQTVPAVYMQAQPLAVHWARHRAQHKQAIINQQVYMESSQPCLRLHFVTFAMPSLYTDASVTVLNTAVRPNICMHMLNSERARSPDCRHSLGSPVALLLGHSLHQLPIHLHQQPGCPAKSTNKARPSALCEHCQVCLATAQHRQPEL